MDIFTALTVLMFMKKFGVTDITFTSDEAREAYDFLDQLKGTREGSEFSFTITKEEES